MNMGWNWNNMFKLSKRSRINYWSCSSLADWIRGTDKPYALAWEGWDEWRKEAQNKHPYRYWVAEKLLDRLQDIIYLPCDIYYTIEAYVRNRFIDKTHCLNTGLKPGNYYDLDYRIIHGLFNELVDLVEIEYAHLFKCYKEKKYKFVHGRCVEAGLDYLKWASGLTYNKDYGFRKGDKGFGEPTEQAVAARKTTELYNWWKNRDNRPDPYEIFSEEKHGKSYYKKISKMQDDYEKEDTKMLIELIKIRGSLWT
jgi:hypothetical protein